MQITSKNISPKANEDKARELVVFSIKSHYNIE